METVKEDLDVNVQDSHWLDANFRFNQPITAGMKEDVDSFLKDVLDIFDRQDGLRFAYFQEIWHSYKFGLIFHGREMFRELYEFTEDLFQVVKSRALTPRKIGLKAAAIYLLYALYFKQPIRPRVPIRLSMAEYKDICLLVDEMRRQTHWDLVFCWTKLVCAHAFHYVACSNHMGLDTVPWHEAVNREKNDVYRHRENPFKTQAFGKFLTQLDDIHGQYSKMKAALAKSEGKTEVNLADENFPRIMKKLAGARKADDSIMGYTEGNSLKSTVDGSTIGSRRRKLKESAFQLGSNVPQPQEEIEDEFEDQQSQDDPDDPEKLDEDPQNIIRKVKKTKAKPTSSGRWPRDPLLNVEDVDVDVDKMTFLPQPEVKKERKNATKKKKPRGRPKGSGKKIGMKRSSKKDSDYEDGDSDLEVSQKIEELSDIVSPELKEYVAEAEEEEEEKEDDPDDDFDDLDEVELGSLMKGFQKLNEPSSEAEKPEERRKLCEI